MDSVQPSSDHGSVITIIVFLTLALAVAVLAVIIAGLAFQDAKQLQAKAAGAPRLQVVPLSVQQSNLVDSTVPDSYLFSFPATPALPSGSVATRSIVNLYLQNSSSNAYLSNVLFWSAVIAGTGSGGSGGTISNGLYVAVPQKAAEAIGLIRSGQVQQGWLLKILQRY